jgi:hypothetical protein
LTEDEISAIFELIPPIVRAFRKRNIYVMIDALIEFFHQHILKLHVLGIIAIILKFVLAIGVKGFDGLDTLFTFFKWYSVDDKRQTSSSRKQRFMRYSNPINAFVYFWLFITILIFIATKKAF